VTQSAIRLYSMAVCPFAQRTRILLLAKRIPYELVELEPTRQWPQWFLDLNPAGQVPVIEHQGRALNESSVINEYLEEVFPEHPLFPRDPYRKAVARIAIEYCNQQFVPALYQLLMNQDAAFDSELVEKALVTWRWANDFLQRHNPEGTWLWDEFGMADLSYATFFQRYCLNEYYRSFHVPNTPAYQRVLRWRDAVLAHPLVQETGMPADDYVKLYEDYARGYGNGAVPPDRERSSFDRSVPLDLRKMPPRDVRG
jgi:glutathione S-transferase